VMLVGITPGQRQATESLREARRCLRDGLTNEETLRSASSVGSFSGPMRGNLVSMLDGIGLGKSAWHWHVGPAFRHLPAPGR
jgi:hypothetical protein